MSSNTNETKWPLIWSLISLNAAIIISWVAYHNYQPILLERFQLNHLAGFLGWAKLIVLLVIPPLSGFIADRMKDSSHSTIPVLTAGIGITALVFMVVASLITPEPILPFTNILPIMILVWLISMNLFYAPALASLERLVPAEQFTAVMGVYFLVSDAVYGLEPAIIALVDFLGASFTFVTGAILVGGAGFWFHRNLKKYKPKLVDHSDDEQSPKFLKVWGIGLGLGVIFGFLINVFPVLFEEKHNILNFGEHTGELLVSGVMILTAIFAYGLSTHLDYLENPKLYDRALVIGIALLIGSFLVKGNTFFVICIAFTPVLAILSIMAFPLAIKLVPNKHKMLAAGLFLAGMELPDSLLEIIL